MDATIGFTAPRSSYEKLRQIHTAAEALDTQITSFIDDPVWKAGWNAWYERDFQPFYEKYAGPNASNWTKLGAAVESDKLWQQTESYRQQLENFAAAYSQKRQRNGEPVPPPSIPVPNRGIDPPEGGRFELPWWIWALGGAAVVGVGYLGYLRAKELTAKRRAIEERVLPRVLDRYAPGMGDDLAAAASARSDHDANDDANDDRRDCGCSHSAEPNLYF